MTREALKAQILLVCNLTKEMERDLRRVDQCAIFSAAMYLIDEIREVVESNEFQVEILKQDENLNVEYVQEQISHLKSNFRYFLGFSEYDDVKPGTNLENVKHFAYKLHGLF